MVRVLQKLLRMHELTSNSKGEVNDNSIISLWADQKLGRECASVRLEEGQ